MASLQAILAELTERARSLELTDAAWAQRAGVAKETLSRIRGRISCDFATLDSLAAALDATLGLTPARSSIVAADALFPAHFDRSFEQRLVDLCRSRDLRPERWIAHGPAFFMAGLAVLLASTEGYDRNALLVLAESLHPGSTESRVFGKWLDRSPITTSRFLPLVDVPGHRGVA